jgi:hypothetical protein
MKANNQTEFYEVFLIDQDFTIERPKRAYRTGFHFMTGKGSLRAHKEKGDTVANAIHPEHEGEVDTDNPFTQEMMIQNGEGKGDGADQMHDEKEHHASQHTFFITNSQRKLKLVTKNAVRPFSIFSFSFLRPFLPWGMRTTSAIVRETGSWLFDATSPGFTTSFMVQGLCRLYQHPSTSQ